jgi:AAA+ superfamily predicted ATPase
MTRVAAGLGEEGLGVAMKQMSTDMNKIAKTLADDMMADAIRARVEEAVERHLANEEDIKNAVKDALPDVIINALRNGGSPTKQIEESSSNEIDIDAILAASGRE